MKTRHVTRTIKKEFSNSVMTLIFLIGLSGCAARTPLVRESSSGEHQIAAIREERDALIRKNQVLLQEIQKTTEQFTGAREFLETAKDQAFPHGKNVDILPMLSFLRSTSSGEVDHSYMVGSYTRLYVENDERKFEATQQTEEDQEEGADTPARRSYRDEHRKWYRRWFMGRSTSRVLTLQATLSYPAIAVTAPLASASFASDRKDGESWATEISPSRFLTPYFRVSPTATLSLKADLQVSSKVEGAITANVVDVLQRASALIAPQAKLVTALNSERLNAASSYVDQSVSALFGESITERSTQDFPVAAWNGTGIVSLSAAFPMGGDVYDGHAMTIGNWTVKATRPIASVFTESPLCSSTSCLSVMKAAAAGFRELSLSPYTVLNFQLRSDTTMIQFLRSLDGFTESVAALNALSSDRSKQIEARQAASRLCALVSTETDRQGLNAPDVAAVVWALSRSGLLNGDSEPLFVNGDTCEAAGLWQSLITVSGGRDVTDRREDSPSGWRPTT